jgi:hypothetical protein
VQGFFFIMDGKFSVANKNMKEKKEDENRTERRSLQFAPLTKER